MSISRRALLIGGAASAAVACCAGGTGLAWLWNETAVDTLGKVDFANRLAIPPLAKSTFDSGQRVFRLRAAEGAQDFGRGPVPTWGFNGAYLGPTLRAARGERVRVEVVNDLSEGTTVHWHGMHVPAAMDGGPHQPIEPGAIWTPQWTVNQPAATLWYHPHPHEATARHVYRGLAGAFIVDDPATDVPDLPRAYAVDDVPIIVQDKAFRADKLDEDGSLLGMGILGDTIVVNGTLAPYLDATTERLRLRVLNASNARVFNLGFSDDRRFAVVGTDGGLLPAPVETDRIMISPGERVEIVVTILPGETAVLRSTPPPLGAPVISRFVGGSDAFDILAVRAARTLTASPPVPAKLVEVPRFDPAAAARHRTIRLGDQRINGQQMDMARIDAAVVRDTIEMWRVSNEDGKPHNLHVHDVQFQVVAVDGGPPPLHLAGWKDTVYVPPGSNCDLALRFADYSDPDMPYMFHCHVLYHEDRGMMGQFVVVDRANGDRSNGDRSNGDRIPAHTHHGRS
jgi:FtsP/CotA-like multicopper oxidase with cupredoxin domain